MSWPRRRVYVDNLSKTHDLRFMVIFLVMVVGALGAVYAVGYVAAGDKVPAHTTVAGVQVGSMSRHEARDVLVGSLGGRLKEPIIVSVGTHTEQVTPARAGLTFDVERTLDDAMGGTDWNPQHMLKVVEGGGQVDPVYRADLTRLEAALAPLAKTVERPAVETSVGIKGVRPVVRPGHPGTRLDVEAAAVALVAALRDHETAIRLHLVDVAPKAGLDAARSFVSETLRPALRNPIVVGVGDESLTVPPKLFAPALEVTQTGNTFGLDIESEVLYDQTKRLLAAVPGVPVDAKIVFQDGQPSVVPGSRGTHVAEAAWVAAVDAAVRSTAHRAEAEVTTVDPEVTTADAKSYGITTRISAASSSASARLAGALSVASGGLDGTVVLPGATFSYVREVGSASASTVLGPLGSASQHAAERADMTITRWPAVSPTGHDLGFRNTTDHPVYLHCWVAPHGARTAVFVQFWGTAAP